MRVKVCARCAEELPDDANVCTTCHKDPSVAPAWVNARPGGPASSWSVPDRLQDEDGSDGAPALADDDLANGGGLGGTARPHGRPIPRAVWGSLALAGVSAAVAFLLPDMMIALVLAIAGHVTGAALGQTGRQAIKNANGHLGGLMFANVTIGLNLIQLVLTLFVLGPLLPTSVAG